MVCFSELHNTHVPSDNYPMYHIGTTCGKLIKSCMPFFTVCYSRGLANGKSLNPSYNPFYQRVHLNVYTCEIFDGRFLPHKYNRNLNIWHKLSLTPNISLRFARSPVSEAIRKKLRQELSALNSLAGVLLADSLSWGAWVVYWTRWGKSAAGLHQKNPLILGIGSQFNNVFST